MRFADWNYWKQGEFERTDGLCFRNLVVEVDTPLGPVEPRTGLPTQFRSRTRHPFEMQSTCRPEGGTCSGSAPVIVRTPDDSTPDEILLNLGENLIQRLPDGGIARWISWPPPWQGSKEAWYGLWRIEHPNGKIERFVDLYSDPGQSYAGYLSRENGKDGVPERQVDGSILLRDGGGRIYARVTGNRFIPFVLAIGTSQQTIRYESSFTGGQFRSLDWASGGYEWAEQTSTYTTPDHARLVGMSRISRQAVLSMRPSEVISLYYSTGRWEPEDTNDYVLARYVGGLVPIAGTSVFLMETMVRQRLFAFRPDIHQVRLSDGNAVPGLLDWSIFPPLDGLQCIRKPKTGFGGIIEQVFTIASTILVSAIPGIGGLAIGLGLTYANAVDKQKLLASAVKAMESGAKFASLAQSAQSGAMEIILKDPPSSAEIQQQARAAGEPVPPSAAGAGGAGILLVIAAIMAAA